MKHILVRKIPDYLENNREEELGLLLADIHPADLAEVVESLEQDQKVRVLALMQIEQASDVMVELSDPSRESIVADLPVERLSEIVSEMDSDDAADIIGDLTKEDAAAVLESIEPQDSDEVRRLLFYDEDTAGGIMQVELISADEDMPVADVVDKIRAEVDDVENLNYVFVVDKNEVLRGWVNLTTLLLAKRNQVMREIMSPCEPVIKAYEDQEEVARKFRKYDVRSAPVVDDHHRLIGRITFDDIFDVFYEEVDEDFYRMAGTSEEEIYSSRILRIARLRLPWLLANLSGGLVTGYLVWLFKVALVDVLALVTFIPAIMALGGSVGIQSSTIVVRGIALGRMDMVKPVIYKEFRVALIMGLVCGLAGSLVASLWHGQSVLGVVVGLSMLSAITLSAVLGALTPILFRRLNIDPALASGPFVTMCNDILGILLYMGFATLLLKYMV